MKEQVSTIRDCVFGCVKVLGNIPDLGKGQLENIHSGLTVMCESMADKQQEENTKNGKY